MIVDIYEGWKSDAKFQCTGSLRDFCLDNLEDEWALPLIERVQEQLSVRESYEVLLHGSRRVTFKEHPVYDPPQIDYTAVRAFNRVWAPRAEMHAYAAYADAAFDGGEWSGPAHVRMCEDEEAVMLEKIGARFGLTGAELSDMVFTTANYEQDRFMGSLFERRLG